MVEGIFNNKLSDVSTTSLLTLYCHGKETKSKNPILQDNKAVELIEKLNPELSKLDNNLYRDLVKNKLDRKLVAYITLRAKKYDEYAKEFLQRSPEGVIVNIGCGLDTRFQRIDNGKLIFYDLDLPPVISLKKKLLPSSDRYNFLPYSVLNYEWMEQLDRWRDRPFLFMAEGVFMYLQDRDVKSLVLKLQEEFSGSELICEVFNSFWLQKPQKKIIDIVLQGKLHIGKEATFNFGIRDSKEMEKWRSGIEFIEEWYCLDEPEKKLGLLRFVKHIEIFRKTLWSVRYKLN